MLEGTSRSKYTIGKMVLWKVVSGALTEIPICDEKIEEAARIESTSVVTYPYTTPGLPSCCINCRRTPS